MKSLILKIKRARINQKKYFFLTIVLLIIMIISIFPNLQSKNYQLSTIIYILWSLINAIILRIRANDMDDFKTTNLDEMHIAFIFGSAMPILNLGIIFYYATSNSKK